jgi:hypothetical protein
VVRLCSAMSRCRSVTAVDCAVVATSAGECASDSLQTPRFSPSAVLCTRVLIDTRSRMPHYELRGLEITVSSQRSSSFWYRRRAVPLHSHKNQKSLRLHVVLVTAILTLCRWMHLSSGLGLRLAGDDSTRGSCGCICGATKKQPVDDFSLKRRGAVMSVSHLARTSAGE